VVAFNLLSRRVCVVNKAMLYVNLDENNDPHLASVTVCVSKNIYKVQENNLSQCAVVQQPRQTGAISVCA